MRERPWVEVGSGTPRPEGGRWATSPVVIHLKKGGGTIHVQMGTRGTGWLGVAMVMHPRSQPRPAAPQSWLPIPVLSLPQGRGSTRRTEAVATSTSWVGSPSVPEGQERRRPPPQASQAQRAGWRRQGAGSALPFGGVMGMEGSPLPFSALISQVIRDTLMVLNQTETREQTRSLINKKSLQDPLFQEG